MRVVKEDGCAPIKIWADDVDPKVTQQLTNLSMLPFIPKNGIASMPDAHWGQGTSIGTVLATERAIIPAAVGVDIGCGMMAVRTSLWSHELPDSLTVIRARIESKIPLGMGGNHNAKGPHSCAPVDVPSSVIRDVFKGDIIRATNKAMSQMGSLGSGNHFIEICIDEDQRVWVMLHSGSRGIGNMIGQTYITKAKELMEQMFITLPDPALAYIPEGIQLFLDYTDAMHFAQDYAFDNRNVMMMRVLEAMRMSCPPFVTEIEAINCHHNYATKENHFGRNVWVTRKGAVRARSGDLGIIPGSMGQRSYIVRGLGNPESYHSCSHGAGRIMSRTEARKRFTVADLKVQTEGVECRKDEKVIDEIPSSYKNIDEVMAQQKDLVEVVHTLKQVLCVKGS